MASGHLHSVGYTSPPDQTTVGFDSEDQEEASERDRLQRDTLTQLTVLLAEQERF